MTKRVGRLTMLLLIIAGLIATLATERLCREISEEGAKDIGQIHQPYRTLSN